MRGVQMADMNSSIRDLFKEDDDTSSSSGSQSSDKSDANYTLPAQDNNAPPAGDVVININDGEEEDDEEEESKNDSTSEEEESKNDSTSEEEESKNDSTSEEEESKNDSTSEEEESKNDSTSEEEEEESEEESNNGSRALMDPSNNDGVEAKPIPNPLPENEPLILHQSKKKKKYVPLKVVLYQAAIKGDWETAKSIFDADPSAITMQITVADDTPLHIAVFANHISFVEKLVELSSSSDLAIKNENGDTALVLAALSGVVKIAKVMVDKNPHLPNVYDAMKPFPLLVAVAHKRRDMVSFLFSNTNFEALNSYEQIELLLATISSDYYDIALDILMKKPELAKARMGLSGFGGWSDDEHGDTALHVIARKPSVIGSSSELSFWKRYMNSCSNRIYRKALMETLAHQVVERIWTFVVQNLSLGDLFYFIRTPSRLLHDAAKVGNVELLKILIRSNPDLLWKVNDQDKSIFHVAVENRQERVFSLIYELGGIKNFVANYRDMTTNYNMLHLAGMLASQNHLNRVSGAALQMQRELLWFKEVEKIVVSGHHEMKCLPDGLTPRELFTKEHKQLQKDGEEWMKNTASSCMLVATLIATIVFAAAFTVPGGNDDKDGIPIFQQNQAFTVFVISDVAALVMSITSILTFLSIMTSRYAEEDFLMSLPLKLLFGLVTLFVSIACMAVAFSATFFLVYQKTETKLPLVIAVVTILPIGCFCLFHFKLVVDIFRSSYWSQFSLKKRAGLF